MDLPRQGLIQGEWDLRGSEETYLGPAEIAGKTVFDVGPASGYLSFEMARRGANVVALEWDDQANSEFGLVPYEDYETRFRRTFTQMVEERRRNIVALRNSFLFAQRALGMEIPIYTGDAISTKPPMQADVALLGCILLHIRDPAGAIYNIASAVRETVIITDLACGMPMDLDAPRLSLFWPSASSSTNVGTWWSLSPSTLREILAIAGFTRFELASGTVFNNGDKTKADIFNLTAWRH